MTTSPREPIGESESKQRAYYDSIADTYDDHYGSDQNLIYRTRVFDRVLGATQLRGRKVLDAMCGGGQNSTYFVGRGADVTGIDISAKQCEHYKRRFPDNEIIRGSALDTGLPDASFDLVFTDSLHHLHPSVNDGVRELSRVLRPGGLLVAWEPSAGSVFDYARKLWYRLDRRYFEDNEASIDVRRLASDHADRLRLERAVFGGNLAYVFVGLSMAMRIPIKWLDYYAEPLFRVEDVLTSFQRRLTALWVMALFEKRATPISR